MYRAIDFSSCLVFRMVHLIGWPMWMLSPSERKCASNPSCDLNDGSCMNVPGPWCAPGRDLVFISSPSVLFTLPRSSVSLTRCVVICVLSPDLLLFYRMRSCAFVFFFVISIRFLGSWWQDWYDSLLFSIYTEYICDVNRAFYNPLTPIVSLLLLLACISYTSLPVRCFVRQAV